MPPLVFIELSYAPLEIFELGSKFGFTWETVGLVGEHE